jgi:hypothetical protein
LLIQRRLGQIVLLLLSVTLVLLPYTEHACNWDSFPSASNDLELQVISCLCVIGLFLVIARQLRFVPEVFRAAFIFASVTVGVGGSTELRALPRPLNAAIPLRI